MFQALRIKYWERIAFNAFTLAKFEKARQAFARLLELAPRRRGLRFNLGLALLAMKRYEEAWRCFLDEKAACGDSLPLDKALAETAYRMGDRAAARQYYSRALGKQPSAKEQAFCSLRVGICADADLFAQAMKAQAILDRADDIMQLSGFESAEPLLQEVCRLDQTSFQAMNNIGAIRLAKKDYAGALDFFRRAEKLVDLPMIQKNLAYLARQRTG